MSRRTSAHGYVCHARDLSSYPEPCHSASVNGSAVNERLPPALPFFPSLRVVVRVIVAHPAMSGGNYMFVMVAEGDTPIYEAEFLNVPRVRGGTSA